MTEKSTKIFSLICIIASIVAILAIGFRLAFFRIEEKNKAEADFSALSSSLSTLLNNSDLLDVKIRAQLSARYSTTPNILVLCIIEEGLGIKWAIPSSSYFYTDKLKDIDTKKIDKNKITLLYKKAKINSTASNKYYINVLYTILDQATVFRVFRDSLIYVGIFLIIAAIILAFIGLNSRNKKTYKEIRIENERPIKEPHVDVINSSEINQKKVGNEASLVSKNFLNQHKEERQDNINTEPIGLYSPKTGLGWSSYLNERLDAELIRSATAEQDLSLLLIEAEDASKNTLAEFADISKSIFYFKDLSFEFGDKGLCIIIPNSDSRNAINVATDFVEKINAHLDEKGNCWVGISSRSGRLVDTNQILEEAKAALEKAQESGINKIVAFKPDADKYRNFLSSKESKN